MSIIFLSQVQLRVLGRSWTLVTVHISSVQSICFDESARNNIWWIILLMDPSITLAWPGQPFLLSALMQGRQRLHPCLSLDKTIPVRADQDHCNSFPNAKDQQISKLQGYNNFWKRYIFKIGTDFLALQSDWTFWWNHFPLTIFFIKRASFS